MRLKMSVFMLLVVLLTPAVLVYGFGIYLSMTPGWAYIRWVIWLFASVGLLTIAIDISLAIKDRIHWRKQV